MNKYEFEVCMQDIFKECKTVKDACNRFIYLRKRLEDELKKTLNDIGTGGEG